MEIDVIYSQQDDKFMFLKGLLKLAKVDGNISSEEMGFLSDISVGFGLSEENIEKLKQASCYDLDSDEGKKFFKLSFSNKAQSIFFIKEAIQLCYIDGKYDDCEKNAIKDIAREIGLSDSTLNKVDEWVCEGIEWKERGDKLIYLED